MGSMLPYIAYVNPIGLTQPLMHSQCAAEKTSGRLMFFSKTMKEKSPATAPGYVMIAALQA